MPDAGDIADEEQAHIDAYHIEKRTEFRETYDYTVEMPEDEEEQDDATGDTDSANDNDDPPVRNVDDSSDTDDDNSVNGGQDSGDEDAEPGQEEAEQDGQIEDSGESAGQFELTAYTAYCDTGCGGVTASGVDVSSGNISDGRQVIATDPGVIPTGSHVVITLGNGERIDAIAEDTGGNINGNRIDLLVETEAEALEFGRQSAQVDIIK